MCKNKNKFFKHASDQLVYIFFLFLNLTWLPYPGDTQYIFTSGVVSLQSCGMFRLVASMSCHVNMPQSVEPTGPEYHHQEHSQPIHRVRFTLASQLTQSISQALLAYTAFPLASIQLPT